MSERALTPSQHEAVAHERGDACVLAGAGSGKTLVLTQRYVALARRAGADVRRIAALTFTEKAAAQMRVRIAAEFASSPDLAARAHDVEFAPISTIHAYCARLLREHAIEAGLDPSFDLLDEAGGRMLREDVFLALERRLRRHRDPRLALLRRLGGEGAWRDVVALHDRLRGLALAPSQMTLARGSTSLVDALAGLQRALDDADVAVGGIGLVGDDLEAFVESRARLPDPALLARATDEAVRRAARAAEPVSVNDIFRLPPRMPKTVTAARSAIPPAYAAVEAALLDEVAAREIDAPLRSLLCEYDAALAHEKRARGVLDFADLELHALALLDAHAARGRALPGRPLGLLVDEFQDVNPVQARILDRLVAPGGSRRTDLFAVGDPRQSIYRFRGADVGVIDGLWQRVEPAGRHRLTDSFRSRPELVAFHGALFRDLFAADGGVPYEPLEARAAFSDATTPIPVEFELVVAPASSGRTPVEAEAERVADRVVRWLDGSTPRTKLSPGGPADPREAVRARDVAILLRARSHLPVFERALAARAVPFHTGKGRGFYDTAEMRDLVHLLRVIHDPTDAFAVAAWLTSPAVGATDEDLLAVFATRPREPLALAARRPALAPGVRAIEDLRRIAAGARLEDLLAEAMARFDLVATALAQDGGARRAKNLEKARVLARRLDEEGGHGLFDFLRHLADLTAREIDEAEAAAGAPDDAVSLLTVHAAKGLEWPCVVVCDTSRKEPSWSPTFLVDADGRVGAKVRDALDGVARRTGGHLALSALDSAAAARESTRLLYVALTRAQERLFISTSVKERKKDGDPARLAGWGATLWRAFHAHADAGLHRETIGGAPVDVRVVDLATEALPPATAHARALPSEPSFDEAAYAEARDRIVHPVASLRRTPFVVPISDVLLFARSPARYYDERILGAEPVVRTRVPRLDRDDPAMEPARDEREPTGEEVFESRRDEGLLDGDVATPDGIDRAALGRAVHRALERYAPRSDVGALVAAAIADEFPVGAPAGAAERARAMVERFLRSATGRALEAALRAGANVRREAAFHARIAFPGDARVGPYGSLLVKGTVDLWLPGPDGRIRVVDHKTNSPRGTFSTPDALVAHYALQLRLYALAVERVTGADVAGASLLLLDPEWGSGVPVEADVDVSGERLRETRVLCQAFATAMLEDRYPERWTDLLA